MEKLRYFYVNQRLTIQRKKTEKKERINDEINKEEMKKKYK